MKNTYSNPGRIFCSLRFWACSFLTLTLFNIQCKKDDLPVLEVTFADPIVETVGVSSAVLTMTISANIANEILERGACWDTVQLPTIRNNSIEQGKGAGTFTVQLTGLTAGKNYYARSYAKSSSTVYYGKEVVFTTLQLPTIQTKAASDVRGQSAILHGSLLQTGGMGIREMGFYLDTLPDPDSTKMRVKLAGTVTGDFSIQVNDLVGGKTYYVMAYAISDAGLARGNVVFFKTALPAMVISGALSNVTERSFTMAGEVTDDGGAAVTLRGICWSLKPGPTYVDNLTSVGSGTGSFVATVTGLSGNTTYYVRAFALNPAGYSYGQEQLVKTLMFPRLTVSAVVTGSRSASFDGTVSAVGSSPVREVGFCWVVGGGTTAPTVADNKVVSQVSGGRFGSSVSSLQPGTMYTVRSYVRTDGGYFYSSNLIIYTNPVAVLKAPYDKEQLSGQVNFTWQGTAQRFEFWLLREGATGPVNNTFFSCSGGFPSISGLNFLAAVSGQTLCVSMPDTSFNGTWYWKVRGYDANNPQDWSETRSFVMKN